MEKCSRERFSFEQELEVRGHLIDSMILTRIFDTIMDLGGDFEVREFKVGKKKTDYSYSRLVVKAKDESHLNQMMRELLRLGAEVPKRIEAKLCPAPRDSVLPNDFYSTTNHPTQIFLGDRWIEVEGIMMDKVVVVDPKRQHAVCKPPREIKQGDLIVVGDMGIKVQLPERPREGLGIFEFMSSRASSEKPTPSLVKQLARDLYQARKDGDKIVVVAGPAVVHTGAAPCLSNMISLGYVQALLSGNALAVHDVEYALFGTSLGIDIEKGVSAMKGNRNHLLAINEVNKAGSLKKLVEEGVLKKGIMYECVKNNVPFSLAGSIRDDGPLPDVVRDTVKAQEEYRKLLKGVRILMMLASTLHSIAVGNLSPSTAKMICVDINPSVPLKLIDRGTAQAVGVVSDVGVFLPLLVNELEHLQQH